MDGQGPEGPDHVLSGTEILQRLNVSDRVKVPGRFVLKIGEVLPLFVLKLVKLIARQFEGLHGLFYSWLQGIEDRNGLTIVVIEEEPEIGVLLMVPALEEQIDQSVAPVRGSIPDDRSELIGGAENAFECLEIFKADTLDDVWMILKLTRVSV